MNKKYVVSEVINTTMIILAVVAFFMQIPIDDSTENIASACIVLVSSLCVLAYLRASRSLETHPISTFALFGFCATSQLGALLVQSFFLQSLANDLRQPLMTFFTLAVFQLVAIAAHMTYRFFSVAKSDDQSGGGLRRFFEKLGLYTTPTVSQLWVMGFIGIISIFATHGGNGQSENVINRISAGISFLAWAPYLIPLFVARIGSTYCNTKLNYLLLACFAVFVGLIGIAANARVMIVSGAASVSFILLMTGMRSKSKVSFGQISNVALVLAVVSATLIPLADLATAMVIVRDSRSHTSAYNMVVSTIDAFNRPALIERERNKEKYASIYKPYDENYIRNPVLARFVMTKFHDNALYFESRLADKVEDELVDTTINTLWLILPEPVLKYLDIKLSKKSYLFSMGDYFYYQATGAALDGYKTGSLFAHGLGLFGWMFVIVYFFICLLSFWTIDLLVKKNNHGDIVLSAVGMLLIWRLYMNGVTSESLNNTVSFLFREIPQAIFLYVIVFQISRVLTYLNSLMDQLKAESLPVNR